MPFFMNQWVYKDEETRALLDKPQDRFEIVSSAMEAFGGKLHQFFFAFGEYDGVAICEFPDKESAVACFMTFSGGGGLKSQKTTFLLSPDEAQKAMEIARTVFSNYKRPSG